MMMTQQDAYDQAVKLRNQGLKWEAIADHLKNAGYISARTGKPLGHLAVRHMVVAVEKREQELAKKDEQERKPTIVAGTDNDEIAGLQKILGMHDIPAKMRKQFAYEWLKNSING